MESPPLEGEIVGMSSVPTLYEKVDDEQYISEMTYIP